MAKPGSDAARQLTGAQANKQLRQMASRALDLNTLRGVEKDAAEQMLVDAEEKLGLRCVGCGRRITTGVRFRRLSVEVGEGGRPFVASLVVACCLTNEDCVSAGVMRDGATCAEMFEVAWFDGGEEDESSGLAVADAPARPPTPDEAVEAVER